MLVSVIYLAAKTVLDFILRTIFIYTLGSTYLGVNGLFSNILMILNLAELGVGNAIIYNLYKPVAENDTERIRSLMLLYRKCYHIIGISIFAAGLCTMPFLNSIIKYDAEAIQHIHFIFLLYLLNSALSYFMVYKTNLVIVHEKSYSINLIKMAFEVLLLIVQSIALLVFKNFYLYLAILIANTIICNFVSSKYAQRLYPEELNGKSAQQLSKQERKHIFKDVYALMLYKIGGVITNGTSNIIISSFVSIAAVGLYSNYLLIINALKMFLTNMFNSITASVGNLNATSDQEKSRNMFYQLTFIAFYLYGLSAVLLWSLVQPFITAWIGSEYLLSAVSVGAIVLSFYITGIHSVSIMFRNTKGLFIKGKYRPIISAGLNIVLSVVLVHKIGIEGVFIAAPIASLLITVWYDPRLILNVGFSAPVLPYYKKLFSYALFFVACCASVTVIFEWIHISNIILLLVLKAIAGFSIFNVFALLLYGKTNEFKATLKTFQTLISNLKKSR